MGRWSGVGSIVLCVGSALVACGPTLVESADEAEAEAGSGNVSPQAKTPKPGQSFGGEASQPDDEPAGAGSGAEPMPMAGAPAGGASPSGANGGVAGETASSDGGVGGVPSPIGPETGGAGGESTNEGEGGETSVPLVVSPEPVLSLGSGSRHQCVLYGAGKVKCWGWNEWGQLGIGESDDRGDEPGEMGAALPDVQLGTGRHAKVLAVGWYNACVILDDDTLKCWGAGSVLGTGDREHRGDDDDEMGDTLLPVALGTTSKPLQVSVGAEHVCVVFADSSAKCFGWNAWGQLGTPTPAQSTDETVGNEPDEMGDQLAALDVGANVKVLQVSAGAMHTCALLSGGVVKCFGNMQGGGSSATGSPIKDLSPVDFGEQTAKQVVAGYDQSCAILDDDTVRCWSTGSPLPVTFGAGRHAVELQMGGDVHTCALLDNHELKCWGQAGLGRLGNGSEQSLSANDELPPLRFGGDDQVQAFSTCVHGCALLVTGEIKCWGWNEYGQLGYGDSETRGDGPDEMGDDLDAVRFW